MIVARGGGSLADLLCFCDETLCRTVALLGVPVIASVGHHTDRTLLDDVAAVSCSTPTHAAEAAVGVDCARARARAGAPPPRACATTAAAPCSRARACSRRSRARPPRTSSASARACTSTLREIRAGSRRRLGAERRLTRQRALVLARKAASTLLDCRRRRPRELEQLALALAGHDPQRTLERGYALVQSSRRRAAR